MKKNNLKKGPKDWDPMVNPRVFKNLEELKFWKEQWIKNSQDE